MKEEYTNSFVLLIKHMPGQENAQNMIINLIIESDTGLVSFGLCFAEHQLVNVESGY